jgi:hypothetical protein
MTAAESNRLPVLQAEIRAAHETVIAAAQSAVERAISAGKLLLEAKSQLGYGEWLPGCCRPASHDAQRKITCASRNSPKRVRNAWRIWVSERP